MPAKRKETSRSGSKNSLLFGLASDIIYTIEYGVVKVSTGDLKLEKLSGATR